MSWLQPRSAYTDHGELLEKENILTGTKLTLTYDERGQLIRAILPGGQTIQYSIDGEGKRLAKTVDGVLAAVYLHDVQGRLVAELEPSGNIKSRFIYATEAHSPDYMIRGGVSYFFAKDQLGSVRAVVDSNSGNVLQLIQYDEFGRVLGDSNPGFQPFGFAGGHYDHQTGLVRFGARDYDPELGRWLSKDPILFGGRQTNLFGYVNNDPVNFVDPSGTIGLPLFAGVAIGVAAVYLGYVAYQNPEIRNYIKNYIQNKIWYYENILDPNYVPPSPQKPRPAIDTKQEMICGF